VSRRARLTVAAAVALLSAIGIGLLASQVVSGRSARARLPLGLRTRAAVTPFAGYRATSVDIDGRCRPVAVADTASRREEGLRGHAALGAYAGMLFANSHDTEAGFTMAGVGNPLEISWYSAAGTRVGGAHLAPCPDHDEAHCPVYRSPRPYRLALETPGGSPVTSALTACG
jgi:uncharacterized membrane protein (UPF0127 family)